MRYLGVDPGEARVGLALSDEEAVIAHPRGHVSGRGTPEQVAERVREALGGEPIARVVVGLPLRLDGSEGLPARRARVLGRAIAKALGVPASFRDERLTTVQAERSLGELGVKGQARRKIVDEAAAALLLQAFLDARTERKWQREREAGEDPGTGRRSDRRGARPPSGTRDPDESP